MQQPRPRIIRPERNSQVSPKRQERHVPSGRIVEVESLDARIDIVRALILSEDDKIMPVQMDGVSGRSNHFVGRIREVRRRDDEVDVPLRVVLRNDRVLLIEGGVFEIEDRGV